MAAGLTSAKRTTLGAKLRRLREDRQLPLWKVAHAAEMDSTLLSKIELGQRLPTREQTARLAKFFSVNNTELESMRMAERFLSDNEHDPEAAALALARIRESASEYFVKKRRRAVIR
jgi:HTH-type transcriptional regulator, competence development regulator